MKVADMFGAGLPALSEPFAGFPGDTPLLDGLRANVAARPRVTWEDEWAQQAWPVLRGG